MTKRLSAVTGNYKNQQGEQKAEWTNIGALITAKNNKDYLLLDPTVNLAGVLLKQNVIAASEGKPPSSSVMVSVFEDSNQGQSNYQQQPQRQHSQPQQPQQQQQGASNNTNQIHPASNNTQQKTQADSGFNNSFDDDIVF